MHRPGTTRFFIRYGFYKPKCRPWRIPRFRCRSCGRTFSRQTFRADYRDRKPHLNAPLFHKLRSGLGLRQSARELPMSLRCAELKFRKIARHLRHLNLNLRGPLPAGSVLQFDELETFEVRRNTRPLTLPVVIDRDSRFILWAESAPIRPRGKMTAKRRKAIEQDERRHGPRPNHSYRSILRTLRRAAKLVAHLPKVILQTDEKTAYGPLARRAFGDRLVHEQTSSKLPRRTWNPLFPINHTEAMARDLVSRLRRESWLASKNARYLDLHLMVHMTYRNYVRERFNFDPHRSSASVLGFVPRKMTATEVLGWRQDWGRRSIHPLARAG